MRFFPILFLFCCVFGFSQKYSIQEKKLLSQTRKLDSLMQINNPKILDLLDTDVSFGHSNGWIQNLDDFKKDFSSGKVEYKEIQSDRSFRNEEIQKYFQHPQED